MKQTSRIISTYSADSMGVCSALFELGGMTIIHDASGCNSTYTTHDEPRWYDMDSMVYISALTEMDAIMGNDEKILSDIEDAVRELHPKFVAISGTPIPTMTGFDFESVARLAEFRTGIPCMGFATTGMNTYIHGASMAFEEIARRFVKEPGSDSADKICAATAGTDAEVKADASKTRVNILGLTPLDFSVNGTDTSIAEWLESENFEIVSKWAMGSTLEEISLSSEADVNLVVSASGLGAARVLHERFGTPYAVGLPIGNEMPGLFADLIKMKVKEFKEEVAKGVGAGSFEAREISLESAESGFAAVIGEGIISKSIASAIEMECGVPAKVLCATECPKEYLRECDLMTPDEDDVIAGLKGAKYVIADPLYKPIVPEAAQFISLPSEAFSGRLYRAEIPNLITGLDNVLGKIKG